MKAFSEWVGLFLIVALFFAACGGVTIGGVHHQVGCSCSRGVVVE